LDQIDAGLDVLTSKLPEPHYDKVSVIDGIVARGNATVPVRTDPSGAAVDPVPSITCRDNLVSAPPLRIG